MDSLLDSISCYILFTFNITNYLICILELNKNIYHVITCALPSIDLHCTPTASTHALPSIDLDSNLREKLLFVLDFTPHRNAISMSSWL